MKLNFNLKKNPTVAAAAPTVDVPTPAPSVEPTKKVSPGLRFKSAKSVSEAPAAPVAQENPAAKAPKAPRREKNKTPKATEAKPPKPTNSSNKVDAKAQVPAEAPAQKTESLVPKKGIHLPVGKKSASEAPVPASEVHTVEPMAEEIGKKSFFDGFKKKPADETKAPVIDPPAKTVSMKDEKIPNPLAEEPVKTDATRSFTIKVPEIHVPKVDLNRVRESWNGSKIKGGIDSAGASVKSFARAHQPKVTGLNGEQVAMDEYLIRKATEFKAETQFKAGVAATKAKVEARNRLDRAERRAKARAQKHMDDVDAYYATQRATMEKVL